MMIPRRKRKKKTPRKTKSPQSLPQPINLPLPMPRERSPSLLLHQPRSRTKTRSLLSPGNPMMKNPRRKPMLATMLLERLQERRASYLARHQTAQRSPRRRGRSMIVTTATMIAKATMTTVTRTGSKFVPHLLCALCVCGYNLFLRAWAVWRLELLSPLRQVESSRRCVLVYLGSCQLGYATPQL